MSKHGNREEGMDIIFEDDWLIVVNKPSGLLSVATNKGGNKGPEVTAQIHTIADVGFAGFFTH